MHRMTLLPLLLLVACGVPQQRNQPPPGEVLDCTFVSGPPPTTPLLGVSRTDQGVWIVGANGVILRHLDGVTTRLTCAALTSNLNGVFGAAPDDVWITGDKGLLLHWDGSALRRVASGTVEDLSRIWGNSWNDVWILARDGVLRSDGFAVSRSLSATPIWSASRHIGAVWGLSAADVWAVGALLTDQNGYPVLSFSQRWQGTQWGAGPASRYGNLTGVWGSASDEVWIAGTMQSHAGAYGMVLRWDGKQLSFPMWNLGGSGSSINGIWGARRDRVWAVGSGTYWWDGVTWSQVMLPTQAELYDVAGHGQDEIWAVGANGTVLRGDGTTWIQIAPLNP